MENFIPYNRWLHQHDEKIKAEYSERPTEEMAQEAGVNYYTMSRRAKALGVSKSKTFMHTSWKKGGNKNGRDVKTELRAATVKYMQAHFANTKNEDLANLFGVDVKTVRRWARRLGLVKSEAFMQVARDYGHRNSRYYTEEQIAYRNRRIAEVYPYADDEEMLQLADELGLSVSSVKQLAQQIGVRRKSRYKPELVAAMAAYFPTHTDKECAAEFGISKPQIQYIARKLGWKKTDAHLQKMYDNNITAAQEHNRKKQ